MTQRADGISKQLLLLVLPLTVMMLSVGVVIDADNQSASTKSAHKAPSLLWTQTVPLPHPDPCLPATGKVESRGVAVGPDHDVVAVGIIASLSTAVVVKYDARSGERIWCTSFLIKATTSTSSTFVVGSAEVRGVAIDSDGTIFIAGHGRTGPLPTLTTAKPGPPAPVPALRYFVTKCSFIGTCASAVTFIHPSLADSHNDTIGGIAIGPDGRPVLTGLAEFPGSKTKSTFKLLTVKLNGSTLALIGTAHAPSSAPGTGSAQGVAVDASNDIFVTGSDASTLKYDSSLSPAPLWTVAVAGSRIVAAPRLHGGDDRGDAQEVAVLRAGVNRGFAIARLDGESGATLWTKSYGSLIETPTDLAVDIPGNILVSGDEGQLISLNRRGEVNWADVVAASSFSFVAVGMDDAPVVSGYTEAPGGRTRAMLTLKYESDVEIVPVFSSAQSDHVKGPHQSMLAWDEPISETVKGFFVCIDERKAALCQDVGSAANLNPRVLSSTTPGSVTYEIPLSRLAFVASGKRRISVFAYNDTGGSRESEPLFIAGRAGQHTFGSQGPDGDRPSR
jgi:hypothetical protein